MSHNYPYRRQPPDSNLRSDPGPYSSSDRRHTSADHEFYQAPQESFSSCYPSSSLSSSRVAQWSQDGALNILNSCGLEPSDLALLAEMPENILTVESLPQVLQHIKGKKGTVRHYPPSSSSSSYASSSTRRPTVSPSTSDWEHPHSQVLRYPMDQVEPSPLPELDRWGNPITFSSVRANPPPPPPPSSSSSSSSSSYMLDLHHRLGLPEYVNTCRDVGPVSSQDYHHKSRTLDFIKPGRDHSPSSSQGYHHRPGPPEFGKTGRDAGPLSSHDQLSLSSADKTTRPSRLPGPADYRSAPQSEESHLKTSWGRSEPETSATRSSTRPAASMPSKQEAQDFHGTTPPTYPHSCSLCAITVMSEKVWLKHINGPHHADGQLSLLQRFPSWDCRMETVGRANNQSERWKDEGKSGERSETANRSSKATQPNKKAQKKISQKSKVVCVKFPAHSVDETYLRKLAEPFGKVVKILMFPSLAFVELGSMDQAKDLVKFHANYPPTVNGELMDFRISHTFNFLQSSRVVSFTPAPSGENGQSDLISIIKRFGSPLYTLFLPSKAFVEMKDTTEAQKLIDYYSSNNLRINDDLVKVSFSGEYKSLMRVASAKRYEEESLSTKRSSSPEKEDKETESRRRRRSRDQRETRTRSRSRSRSRDKSSKDKTTRTRSKSRSRSRDKSSKDKTTRSKSKSRSRSRDKSSKDKTTRTKSRSRSRSRSRDKSSKEKRSGSREGCGGEGSRERRSRSQTGCGDESATEKTEMCVTTESSPDPHPVKDSKPEDEEPEEEAESADESDIEGMEVIGEDGENVHDEEEEETAENDDCPAEKTDSPEGGKKEVKKEEADHQEEQEEEKEDPVEQNDGEEEKPIKEEESGSSREAEETTETQLEEDEQEADFPLDLDNCITLDELEEEETDNQGGNHGEEVGDEAGSSSRRVLYLKNVPLGSFTDAEFLQLVKGFGTAVRFFRIPGRQTGFIEMSSSAEAQQALSGLNGRKISAKGCTIHAQISRNYRRLTSGWTVESVEDLDEEKKGESRSQGGRKSERLSKSKTTNRDTSNRKSEEGRRKQSSRKVPEKETKTQDKESKTANKKSSEKESASRKSSEKSSEKETVKKASEKISRAAPEKDPEHKQTPEKELSTETSPEKTLKRKGTDEDDSVPEKKEKKSEAEANGTPEAAEEEEGKEEVIFEPGLKDSVCPEQPDSTGDPPKPPTEQKPAADQLIDSEVKVQRPCGPAGGAAELQKPPQPVGIEFVRPVVGYFCNLCQLIYADEDEAKQQHCSRPEHYRKYQEKTGKDPWAS